MNASSFGDIGWVIEVLEIGSFVRMTLREHRESNSEDPLPAWVHVGETTDGRRLGYIDVKTMIEELCAPT